MQNSIELKNNGMILRGMLHIPDGVSGKMPGVVMFHGFTGNKMESHFLFVKLSRELEKEGIASIRFDFLGSGESDGSFEYMTPETELSDAKAILQFAGKLDFVDTERVGLCGLSMGGYIAGITAGDNRELVRSLCMWAPAGNIKEIFKLNMSLHKNIGEGLYDLGGFILNSKAYDSAVSIDHLKRTSEFDKETCIIHGTNDQSVPYEIGLHYKNVMKTVEFHTVEGGDHTFTSAQWERKVIGITKDFFKRTL